MTDAYAGIAVVGCLSALMAVFGAFAIRTRRRGRTASAVAAAMAAYDEALHSTAYDSFVEMQAQDGRLSPVEAPGPKGSTGERPA